jgi:Dolichyl-phosphate-mannose-protein mannosyltransferase
VKSSLMKLVWAWIVLLATLGLAIGYYIVHKPFELSQALILLMALRDASVAIGVIVGAGGLGRFIWPRLGLPDPAAISNGERVALEALLGMALLSPAAALLGLLGIYQPPALAVLMLGCFAISARAMFAWLATYRLAIRNFFAGMGEYRGLALYCLLMLGLIMTTALAPPTAWDALAYHLNIPRAYLATGRIFSNPENFFFGFSHGLEILYGVVMALTGGINGPAFMHWLIGVLALMAIGGLVKRHTDGRMALLAITLLLTSPSLVGLFGKPYIDLGMLLCGACVLVIASCWAETRRNGWLIALGMCLGFAVAIKYVGGALAMAVVLWLLWQLRGKPAQAMRAIALVAVVAGAAFAIWALKGVLLYQNPVYPFLFHGPNWDADRAHAFSGDSTIARHFPYLIPVLPITATLFGDEGGGALPGVFFTFTTGMWLLTAWLAIWPGWSRLPSPQKSLARLALWLGGPLLLFWMALSVVADIGVQPRLMMIAMPVAAVLGALALGNLRAWAAKPIDIGFIMRGLLVFTLLLNALGTARQTLVEHSTLSYYLNGDPETYLNNTLSFYMLTMRHLDTLPVGGRVLFLWEPRAFYCPTQLHCVGDVMVDHWHRPVRSGVQPNQVLANWRTQKFDYILVSKIGLNYYQNLSNAWGAASQLFPAAAAQMLQRAWENDSYALYVWR